MRTKRRGLKVHHTAFMFIAQVPTIVAAKIGNHGHRDRNTLANHLKGWSVTSQTFNVTRLGMKWPIVYGSLSFRFCHRGRLDGRIDLKSGKTGMSSRSDVSDRQEHVNIEQGVPASQGDGGLAACHSGLSRQRMRQRRWWILEVFRYCCISYDRSKDLIPRDPI